MDEDNILEMMHENAHIVIITETKMVLEMENKFSVIEDALATELKIENTNTVLKYISGITLATKVTDREEKKLMH